MKRIIVTLTSLLLASALLPSCRQHTDALEGSFAADTVRFADNLRIEYFDQYTAVSIRDPWDTLRLRQRYLLVDRDMPLPADLPEGTLVRVPVERAAVYTSVHAAMAEKLGAAERVCGVCEPQYITSPGILKLIDEGRIADLGLSTAPDIEKIIDLDVDVIIASPFENSSYGAAEKLMVPIVEAADYMESHPLGRTEWILFYGLLFGKRAEADSILNITVDRYMELKALAADATERPTVLLERRYGSSWAVPPAGSYIGQVHRDAGADYVFADITGTRSIPLSFETVYDKACDADIWMYKYNAPGLGSYKGLEEEYAPYCNFRAFKEKRTYGCNTAETTYYDDITLHPDWLLEDLISIYHPELLPDHENRYYFPLTDE